MSFGKNKMLQKSLEMLFANRIFACVRFYNKGREDSLSELIIDDALADGPGHKRNGFHKVIADASLLGVSKELFYETLLSPLALGH